MTNEEISKIFDEIADMMEIEDDGKDTRRFEIRAYRRAAVNIGTLQEDVEDLYAKGGTTALLELPGIGKGLSESIVEFIKTGSIKKYVDLKKKYPVNFTELTKLQGMGSRRIVFLYKNLGIKDMASLKKALESHAVSKLPGFGSKSEAMLLKSIEQYDSSAGRTLLGIALPEAERLKAELDESGFAERVEIAGSIRRMRETVGDIDMLVISEKPEKILDFISGIKVVKRIVLKGKTKITVILRTGISCDIRIVGKNSFGSAMQYFTGSKDHGVKLRQIAIKKGFKLSEYGMFSKNGGKLFGKTEKEIYNALGLDYVEPEMRENRGEIELAAKHSLPNLVRQKDILGDLHTHTIASDGQASIEEMVAAAHGMKYKYIGISDHTKSEYVARGMDDAKFIRHLKRIDEVAKKYDSICVLKSAEIDILKDGTLDLKKSTIGLMDYTLASIHSYLNMSREDMTKRVIKAFDSGLVGIWAHPTDRLIGSRQPIPINLDKVFEAAKRNNVVMEINSFPTRLDLNDENILRAREFGLKFVINTDSHSTTHLQLMRYGIGTARRGWLEKRDVINTMNYKSALHALSR